MTIEEKYKTVLDCSFKVHKTLGAGLLERVYQECLAYELKKLGFVVELEKYLDVKYEDIVIDKGYRVDMIIDNEIIVEFKSVDKLKPIHTSQILTYMRLSNIHLGLLVNFNERYLKEGIKRVVY